jgi:hypothetical protein
MFGFYDVPDEYKAGARIFPIFSQYSGVFFTNVEGWFCKLIDQ